MSCGAIGAVCKMLVQGGSTPRTFSVNSERYPVITEGISPKLKYSGQKWGVGEIGQTVGARRTQAVLYEGNIELECSKYNLLRWLPRALFTSQSVSPFSAGNNPDGHEFDILLHKETSVFRYYNCLVNELVVYGTSAQDDSLMTLAIGIVCARHTEGDPWPNPEPPLATSSDTLPYIFHETETLLDQIIELPTNRVLLAIQNNLIPVVRQSLYAQKFRTTGREILLAGDALFNSDSIGIIQGAPEAAFDTYFNISNPLWGSVSFDLKNLQNISPKHPEVRGRSFIPLEFRFQSSKPTLATPELVATIT